MSAAVQRQKDNDPTELKKQVAALRKELDRVGKGQDRAEANEKANHSENIELRSRVADLERQLAAAKKTTKLERINVVKAADLRRLEDLVEKIDALIRRSHMELARHLDGLRAEAIKIKETATAARTAQLHDKKIKSDPKPTPSLPKKREPVALPIANGVNGTVHDTNLKPVHLRLLSAIAWWESIGVSTPDLGGVAFVAKTSTKSSAFDNNRSRLRAGGYIDYPSSGRVQLTDAGRALAPPSDLPPTNEALHDAIFSKITPAHGRMLRALIEAYPGELSLEDFAKQAGTSTSSSAFDNNRSWLRARGLAEYPRTGFVRATSLLFPEEAS
jgi:hypothetical protein